MDRRLKIITIALSVVYVIIIGGSLYEGVAEFMFGVKRGFTEGQAMVKTGEIPSISTVGGTFFLSVKPEKGIHTFPTTMLNQLDGKPMIAEIEKMIVEVSNFKDRLPKGTIVTDICSTLLSFFAIFVMFLIPVQAFRMIRSITRNKIFDPANIRKLRSIGYALLAFYVANLIVTFIHYRLATNVLSVEGYTLRLDWGNITFVLLGFVVLLFAEVLKVSVQLKEEQDLTV